MSDEQQTNDDLQPIESGYEVPYDAQMTEAEREAVRLHNTYVFDGLNRIPKNAMPEKTKKRISQSMLQYWSVHRLRSGTKKRERRKGVLSECGEYWEYTDDYTGEVTQRKCRSDKGVTRRKIAYRRGALRTIRELAAQGEERTDLKSMARELREDLRQAKFEALQKYVRLYGVQPSRQTLNKFVKVEMKYGGIPEDGICRVCGEQWRASIRRHWSTAMVHVEGRRIKQRRVVCYGCKQRMRVEK